MKSTREFDEVHWEQFSQCFKEVEEVFVDNRDSTPQMRYVVHVPSEAQYYGNKVSDELVGFWIQRFPDSNTYDTAGCLIKRKYEFIKCEPVDNEIKWVAL